MAYKRRARVLFLGPPELASAAVELSRELGAEWLESDTAEAPASGWADLVVTLDPVSRDHLPALPATSRHKHWNVDTPAEVRERVAGMIGGMRLLARLPED
ncbi:hypothetical protein [Acidihalobacter prosperus]